VRLIDTAGIRRRGKVAGGPAAERFATLRALKAVSRSDVSVLVVDAQDGLTAQDDHVAGYALEEGTGLVIAINKWDVVEKDEHTFDEYAATIRQEAPFLDVSPILAISAKTGQRVGRVLEAALEIAAERRRRVPTAALTAWLRDATLRRPAPNARGKQPRFFYATQVAIEPPTFVIFASEVATLHFSYKRFLENQLRDTFGFSGTPIRLVLRERAREEGRARPRGSKRATATRKPTSRRVSSTNRR
jgi:GTP-binding protein